MKKLIINAAITGMVPQKSDNADVPITIDEIVAEVKRCEEEGASVVHLHARNADGTAAFEEAIYEEIYERCRATCPDILISGSTSGRVFREFGQRSQSITTSCKPDFGSLTLGSMNFPKQASVNEPDMIVSLAKAMNERGIVPEWECFDIGMIDYGRYLTERGVLKPPFYCNLFLGSLGTLSASAENLAAMVRALPPGAVWSAAGIGRFEFFVNSMAIVMGGHVRVGLEDNLFFDDGKTKPATNAGLIRRLVRLAEAAGRSIASPSEAREIIGLPPRASQPGKDALAYTAAVDLAQVGQAR